LTAHRDQSFQMFEAGFRAPKLANWPFRHLPRLSPSGFTSGFSLRYRCGGSAGFPFLRTPASQLSCRHDVGRHLERPDQITRAFSGWARKRHAHAKTRQLQTRHACAPIHRCCHSNRRARSHTLGGSML